LDSWIWGFAGFIGQFGNLDGSVRTGKFLRTLPRDPVTLEIVRQLAESSGGLSANYHACCRARSRAEFIAKLGLTVEEADESEHWLRVLVESDIGIGPELDSIYNESRELRAVFKRPTTLLGSTTNANNHHADGLKSQIQQS
jgi:four helix bundle protein